MGWPHGVAKWHPDRLARLAARALASREVLVAAASQRGRRSRSDHHVDRPGPLELRERPWRVHRQQGALARTGSSSRRSRRTAWRGGARPRSRGEVRNEGGRGGAEPPPRRSARSCSRFLWSRGGSAFGATFLGEAGRKSVGSLRAPAAFRSGRAETLSAPPPGRAAAIRRTGMRHRSVSAQQPIPLSALSRCISTEPP